jgi:heptosyltransferase-2
VIVEAERILIVQSGFLGDVVLTTPLLAALRRRFPHAWLAMLVTPAAAPLVAHHPALDAVLTDDKRGAGRGMSGLAVLARRIRAERCTTALAAHKSLRTALALRAGRIPRRIGFTGAPGAALYTERVERPLAWHDRDRLLALLAPLGAVPAARDDCHPWVALDQATRDRAAALLATAGGDGRPLAALCPGSAWATKRWPAAADGALALRLDRDGYRCVLVGAPDERDLAAAVQTAAGGCAVDLTGQTDVALLAAVLARMSVVVSNDSAPMHLAAAARVPQVAVFCATVPAQGYGPVGTRAVIVEKDLACRPCGRHGGARCPRDTRDCMELIEVSEVRAAVERARALAA